MFRYIAFVWNDFDPTARQTAKHLAHRVQGLSPDWRCTLTDGGLTVLHAGERRGAIEAYQLSHGSGAILGKIFSRAASDAEAPPVPLTLDGGETQRIIATHGQHLIDHYWGRYVAFLREASSGKVWVLRDPTGGLPCLKVHCSGVDVYFSSMDECVRLALSRLSVNWRYLIGHICYQQMEIRETGLNEVTQLLGGECVEYFHGQQTSGFYWDPLKIANTSPIEDPAAATEALRRHTRSCVQAWASGYNGIIHTLSGGLDSSIVLTCLKNVSRRPRITCVNYHSPGPDSDERHFARLTAQRAGFELLERERFPDVQLEALLGIGRGPKPLNYRYYLENSRYEAQLAAERSAEALFNGEGGDSLFYQSRASFAPEDYLRRHGLRPALIRIALDAAQMDNLSVWQVLREAFSRAFRRRSWSPQTEAAQFHTLLSRDLVEAVRYDASFLHPCLWNTDAVASGKIWHISQLIIPQEYYDPFGHPDFPERVAPLLSQPLVELCLRIPTYVLTVGGWDRAIARRAFRDELPSEISTRRSKGGLEEYLKQVRQTNGRFLRELLLDGFLVREKIVDRAKLEEVLSDRPSRIDCGNVEIFDYMNVEVWLKGWEPLEKRAAA